MEARRGEVWAAVHPDMRGVEKFFVIVSNNRRNAALRTYLAVKLTTSPKPPLRSIVEIPSSEPMAGGRANCDDVYELWPDDLRRKVSAFTPGTMRLISAGLRAAFAIDE